MTQSCRAASTALANSLQVNVGRSMLYKIIVYNSGSAQFIQVHNAASAPADTAVPVETLRVGASSQNIFEFWVDDTGDTYSNGIYICNSTTAATKTIGAADCWFSVRYKPL